jgi:hypothetical protein
MDLCVLTYLFGYLLSVLESACVSWKVYPLAKLSMACGTHSKITPDADEPVYANLDTQR